MNGLRTAQVLAPAEHLDALDVTLAPPALDLPRIAAHEQRVRESVGISERIGDPQADHELLVVAGVADQCPAPSGGGAKEVPGLEDAADLADRLAAAQMGADRLVAADVGDVGGRVVRSPGSRQLDRRHRGDQKLVVVGGEDHPRLASFEVVVELVRAPTRRQRPVGPVDRPRAVIAEVLVGLDQFCDRRVSTVSSDDEIREQSFPCLAASLNHHTADAPGLVADEVDDSALGAQVGARVGGAALEQPVQGLPTKTVGDPPLAVGQLHLVSVIGEAEPAQRRRGPADRAADPEIVQLVHPRGVNQVGRDRLIAWQLRRVEERDGQTGGGEPPAERGAGAPGPDHRDVEARAATSHLGRP